MTMSPSKRLKVLITVKTYPIPSKKYDELVCTAGVTETGDFIRLYPINFRDLPYDRQFKKYQWIEVGVRRHRNDVRKESYLPESDSILILGKPIPANPGNWSERAQYVLKNPSRSMEELYTKQEDDNTSLGIFKPKNIKDLLITKGDPEWPSSFLEKLRQYRLFESRKNTLIPPRKVPFKFHFLFECDDSQCNKSHKMMIEDWELGVLFWKLVDEGYSHSEACQKVKEKFLHDICGPKNNTYFYVGTILAHPKTWVIVGLFYPKIESHKLKQKTLLELI